ENWRAQLDLASELHQIGYNRRQLGERAESLAAYQEARDIRSALLIKFPDNVEVKEAACDSHKYIGDLLLVEGEYERALAAFRAALEITRSVVAKLPAHQGWRGELASCLECVGDALLRLNDEHAALAAFREALAIQRTLVAADPQDALVGQRGMANIELKI